MPPIHNQIYDKQGLSRSGPALNIEIGLPPILLSAFKALNKKPPKPIKGVALIDTGASTSAIDVSVAARLGLIPLGRMQGGTAKGHHPFDIFAVKFRFPETGLGRIDFKRVLGADLSGQNIGDIDGDFIALIGRDILKDFVFIYNGPQGMYTLSC